MGRRAARRGALPALQVHVFRPRPGTGQTGHSGIQPQPDCGGGLFTQPARTDVSPRGRECRFESLSGADGQHSRAGLLGHRRPGGGLHQGPVPPGRGHPPRRRARALAAAVRPDSARGAGRGRRHRRDSGRVDAGRRRQGRDSGRTRAEHRRPHGHVRQDLSHAGLRRLHPHAQDDGGQTASQHQAADLLHRRIGGRIGGQLPGQGPPQAALHRRGSVRRLHDVHRRLRVHQGPLPQSVRPGLGHAQAGVGPLRPGRAAGSGDRPGSLSGNRPRQVQAGLCGRLRRTQRDPLRPAGRGRGVRGRNDHHRHGVPGVRSRR